MVELGDVGAFPNVRKPQTVWLGITGPEPLAGLAEAVERALSPLGFPSENRPYRAHLTVGRVKSSRGLAALARRLEEARREAGEPGRAVRWPVDEIHLVRSELRPDGPRYTVLERFPLGAEE